MYLETKWTNGTELEIIFENSYKEKTDCNLKPTSKPLWPLSDCSQSTVYFAAML